LSLLLKAMADMMFGGLRRMIMILMDKLDYISIKSIESFTQHALNV
jgi:hypothetical protein